MDAVSSANADTIARVSASGDGHRLPPLKKAIGQDEASALALLSALPAPASDGMLGTQLDAWA